MFAKLLKHEFKNSRGLLGLLSLICLGVGVVVALAMKLILVGATDLEADGTATLMALPLLIMGFLAIAFYPLVVQILQYVQFYRSRFTDQGYLTFTLPTDVHKPYLASLVNMLIWQAISYVVTLLSLAIFVFFGTSADQFFNTAFFETDWSELETVFQFAFGDLLNWETSHTVLTLLQMFIGFLASPILATAAITVGSTVAQKHKAWASLGLYFAMSYAVSAITSAISSSISMNTMMGNMSSASLADVMVSNMLLGTLVNVAVIVGGYWLTTRLMKNKLNLP